LLLQYQNKTILSEMHTAGINQIQDSTPSRVLIADVILSDGNSYPATSTDNFTSVGGGFTQNGRQYTHVSAHLKGSLPRGANIAYKDGHAQWKKFASPPTAATPPSDDYTMVRTISGPWFWW
jgi:hypothetical protein